MLYPTIVGFNAIQHEKFRSLIHLKQKGSSFGLKHNFKSLGKTSNLNKFV